MHAFENGFVLQMNEDKPIHIRPSDTDSGHEACLYGHGGDRGAFLAQRGSFADRCGGAAGRTTEVMWDEA
jgi:hypothetical protein